MDKNTALFLGQCIVAAGFVEKGLNPQSSMEKAREAVTLRSFEPGEDDELTESVINANRDLSNEAIKLRERLDELVEIEEQQHQEIERLKQQVHDLTADAKPIVEGEDDGEQ